MTEACIYCGAITSEPDRVPAVDDDDGWEEEASEHDVECEWVLTRAHRREVPRD